MDFSKIPIFAMMVERMNWLGKRQQVLAENVANADTPGYRPKDVAPQRFDEFLSRQRGGPAFTPVNGLRVTHVNHIQAPLHPAQPAVLEPKPAPEDVKASGNAVVLEEELMKVGKTAMDYQLTTSLYARAVNMVRTAIGRGGR